MSYEETTRILHEVRVGMLQQSIAEITSERDKYRARANLLENLLHELADEARTQKRTAAYQRRHGQPATAGRRRIDIEGYLERAGIEVLP